MGQVIRYFASEPKAVYGAGIRCCACGSEGVVENREPVPASAWRAECACGGEYVLHSLPEPPAWYVLDGSRAEWMRSREDAEVCAALLRESRRRSAAEQADRFDRERRARERWLRAGGAEIEAEERARALRRGDDLAAEDRARGIRS